ncbi:hypothetical protein K1719_000166 [Acacia pycnantha]|nr:hypothetical protein K1719_000166 [Acacia pycnantha]
MEASNPGAAGDNDDGGLVGRERTRWMMSKGILEVGMVGKDDSQKMFWRSASRSAPRSAAHNPDGEEKDFVDPDGSVGNINGESRRYPPSPLTPRSQQNCKAQSFLPPLQPLSIDRRSLD